MTDHNELAARIERAEGADRALDAEIHALLNPDARWVIGHEEGRFPQEAIYGSLWDAINVFADKRQAGDYINAPAYTASIDAAMQLVEDQRVILNIAEDDITTAIVGGWQGCADSPALALCAAAIRARSAS